jgi:3-deoxy-D-manno-octulosonic-acid transferase
MSRDTLAYCEYNAALLALSPLIGGYCAWSAFRVGRSWSVMRRQLGLEPPVLKRIGGEPRVWIQAVSVGETVASQPVFTELRKLLPSGEFTLSTTTTAGNAIARKSVPEADNVIYFPLDVVPAVRRTLDAVTPRVFASMESEIWPNFLYHCRRRSIPVAIVNGIVSDRTYRWGRKFRSLYKWTLGAVDTLKMQSQEDANRIIALGARPERVEVIGNCKFDQLSSGLSDEGRREWRSLLRLRNGEPVFVAGSTNPGEEEQVLDAYKGLRQAHSDLKLVIAPRQLNRSAVIRTMVSEYGFSCGLRSEAESFTGGEDVIVLDTMGELASIYGIATVAFVGGSLIPKGGHNILQPIAHGRPVLFGPYMHKSRDLMRVAKEAGVGLQVADSADLGRTVDSLLRDSARLGEIQRNAVALIDRNRGAARRCAEAIAELCRA